MNDKRDQLYNNLINSGKVSEAEIGSLEDFKAAISDEAKTREFYNNIIGSGLLTEDEIGSEDDFYGSISDDFAAPQQPQAPAPSQGYQPSAEDMAAFGKTIGGARQTVGQSQQAVNRIGNMQQRVGLDLPQDGRINLGENRKVTKGQQRFNIETGQMENTYVTEAGNEYGTRAEADLEQNAIDDARRREANPLGTDLEDAYQEQRRLQTRIDELEAKQNAAMKENNGFVYRDKNIFTDEEDAELQNLKAARRQNEQTITTLEAERDDDGSTQFWRGFTDAATNPSVYTLGLSDLNDMYQLWKIKGKLDKASETGENPQLNESEELLLKNSALNNYAQSKYGENRGFMYRAGNISMQALPFVGEFILTGGFGALTQAGAKLGTKAAEKMALEGLKKSIVKNTGVLMGDIAAGWAMANTTGIGRTAADIMQRNMGDVTINPEGEYDFGHYDENDNFIRGGKSLGRSIYEGEVANTLEYYTEMLGNHLQFGKWISKGLDKLGLSKLSKAANYLSSNKWLERGGIQDYPSEVFEEEANIVLNSILVGDNSLKDLGDKKTQLDIWGGLAFSIGLMQAPRVANTGRKAAGYYGYKYATDAADAKAQSLFGADNWQMIKEEIDNCTNEDLPALMETVVNGKMNQQQKEATLFYADNLLKMRGYNTGLMADIKGNESTGQEIAADAIDQSYQQGHEAQDPDIKKQYVDEAQAAADNLPQYGEEFAKMVTESDNPVETMNYLMDNQNRYYSDDEIAAAADYYQKKSRAEGVMDAAADGIDLEVQKANAEVMANTHQATGDVILAKGEDDIDYYIIGGDVITDPDTGVTSLVGTGGAIVVKDPITGDVSVKSPQDVMVYSMQPAAELIQQNETVLRQQLMQQADDDITFGSPANEVFDLDDTVTLSDGEGGVIDGEIVTLPNAVDGVFVIQTNDGRALQMTADDMNRRIVAHNGMGVQRATPQPVQPVSEQNDTNLEQQSGVLDNAAAEESPSATPEQESSKQPQSALSRIPVRTDKEGQPLKNKKGRTILDWHKASVEDAAAALVETTGGDMVLARDTASDLVKNEQARLEKIRKQKPTGDDPIEIAESRVAIRQQELEQQAIIKQWQDVGNHIRKQMDAEAAERRAAEEAAKSEEQRQREAEEARIRKEKQDAIAAERRRKQIEEEVANWNKPYTPLAKARKEMEGDPEALDILNRTEPESLEEWVSSLIQPHSMMWDDETDPTTGRTVIGLQSELGLQKKDIDRIGGLLAPSNKGGKPFGQVVHDIWESLPEGMKNMYTDQDVRNALIGLFGEGNTMRMRHLTEEHRIEEARAIMKENARRDAEAEMDAWAEFYHLTPEERETFEDFMQQEPYFPEEEVINQIIAENEEKQSIGSQELDSNTGSRGGAGEIEGGESQVQQAAETAGNGNPEQGATAEGETATGEQAPVDDNVPGEGSIFVTPKKNVPLSRQLVSDLAEAYASGDPSAIRSAVVAMKAYVDEGGDFENNEGDDYFDYDGNDPQKLALQYKERVLLDRYLDDDEDQEYINTGLKPNMRQSQEQSQPIGKTSSPEEIKAEEEKVDTNPTDGQKEAGNYQKGHINVDGYDITIENPKDSIRSGVDDSGKKWEQEMHNTYGYIRGTEGVDGDHIDVFLSDNPTSGQVFVVDQVNPKTGEFDEHKVMYGFADAAEATQAYLSNYEDGWKGLGAISGVSREAFKEWVESSHRKTKPFAEYKSVKKEQSKPKPEKQHKRIVSDDQMEDLRKKLREKFGTLNAGIDVERMLLGAMYAVGKIERGVTKFADYAAEMVEEIGDAIRPYLKAFYEAVRNMPEAAEYRDQMTSPEEVAAFDEYNFDKQQKAPDAITKAEQVVQKQKAKQQVKKIEKEVNQKIQQGDLFARDLFGGEAAAPQQQTEQPKEPVKPKLNKKDYRTYMTPEAREYFANDPRFAKFPHPELAFVTAAVWDGVVIPVEELAKIPAIVEAEQRVKSKEELEPFSLTDEQVEAHAQHLLDAEHGSAVYKEGKLQKVNGHDDFSGPVKQERKAFIIIGRPAGGKSSVFANPLSNKYGARIIDSDTVKEWFDEFDDGYGAGYVQNMSSKVADRALDIAVQNGDNVILPRIGGNSVKIMSAALRLAGYDVQLYYNDVVPDTSYMRSQSRFAMTGRYLSLDYLTSIKDKPSETFSNFAEETIGDYINECSKEQIQKLRGRLERLVGGKRSDLWRALSWSLDEEGRGNGDGTVSGAVERSGADGNASHLDLTAPIFSYAEWKSNDVAFGDDPKEIWNSKSGKPMPGKEKESNENNNELHSVRSEQGLSAEPSPSGEETGKASGSAERPGAERGPEQNRAERSGRGHSVTPQNNLRNNHGERGKDYAPTSPKARFNANVESIKLMRQLMDEGVENPTQEQKEILRKYSGWGGMGTFFNDATTPEYRTLMDLLDEDEFKTAAMSINSAYFTPAMVIDSMWDIAEAMGFKGGNVLEGSAGIGNIIGQMPTEMSRRSNIEAVEIDKISGNILKLLYPDAKVHIQGFQDTKIPNGSVDLAITNVPFVTGLHVFDKVDKDLSRKFTNIHDFCIAKNIRKLREGGIGIFISSSGTLDKSNDLRAWITDDGQSDVVGAFRLNNETFGGTTATSDIIIVRKRVNNQKSPNAIDISSATPMRVGTYEDKYGDEKQTTMTVNDYFQQHPEMMAGEMAFGYEKGDTFRPGSYGLYPVEGKSQEKMLQGFVKEMDSKKETASAKPQTQQEPVKNQLTAEKEGRMLIDDNGRLCISRMGTAVPLSLNDQKVKGQTKQQCFKDYQEVQKAVDDVLQQQLNDPDDANLQPKLKALNAAYDKFTKRYGTLHKNTAISFLRNDIDFPSFLALENYSETKDMKGKVTVTTKKAPLFSQRVLGFKTEPKPKTVKDAVIASMFRSNGIDLEWIAEKLSEVAAPPNGDKWTADDVRKGILVSRLGFEDPSTRQIEIRYKYLSGNVREKLAIAEAYNTDGRYAANVEELRKAVPMDIPSHLIDFSIGSSWIPVELYKDYLKEVYDLDNVTLSHVEGSWVMSEGWYRNEKNRAAGVYSEQFRETIYGHQLVAAAMNNRPVKVSKQVSEGYGSNKTTKTVVDKNATQACAVRVDEIKDEFKQWAKKKMQDDPELSARIEKIYNDKFNALVPMEIDEEFLPEHFEGSNVNITLRPHQKTGTMRGLTSPTMLAHEVGTGKSFTLITTAMEMRRLGTARKPMLVVQNATVAQLTSDAKLLYPNAKVLALTEKDRDAEGRRAFYASIKYNDWDLIIIPQSTLNMIPDSPERELQFIQEKIDEKKHVIEAAMQSGMDSREIQRLKKELDKLEEEYGDTYLDSDPANGGNRGKKKKKDTKREAASLDKAETKAKEQLDRQTDDVQFFDDLGVDALLVDEAHEYKHLGFQTSIGRGIKGVDPSYSKKCAGLYNKTRSVYEKAGWKNVVFATGTPISNTAAEIWTFMKYLMPADMMRANDIYYFDDFVHNFGSISQSLEFATSGKFKENTRFAAYVNKPELIRIWSQVADTVLTKDAKSVQDKLPQKEGGKDQDIFLPQSPSLVSIMTAVRAELERFENMTGQEKKENSSIPLTMYGIAKRAAIDPRLVNPDAPDEPMSKTNAAVKEIVKDLKATESYKGTVAVFCDNQNRLGYNGEGKKVVEFNIYDDMKQKLMAQGVPESQIAIIKSGMSITAKQKVFDAVNAGTIRVVLGSTQTLGTGVNMQERLHLLIHMDAPDRPMDYTQRNGRIERQGNLHKEWGKTIRIVRFGVEDSLDVTAYQRLKTKSGFIDSIMDGKAALANNQVDRTVEEEEEGLFDNPVAVLSGSQYALKKNQAERELRKYQGKKSQWEADQTYVTNQLRRNQREVESAEANIKDEEKDLAHIRSMFPDGKVKTITVEGVKADMAKDNGAKILGETIKEKINDPVNAIVKRNRENPIYNDESMNFTIALDGHDVNFKVDIVREAVVENGKMRTVIHKYTSYTSPELRIDSMTTSKSVKDCLEEIIDQVVTGQDYQDRIDAYKAKIDRLNAESEQLEKRVGMEFQYGKELEQAKKNVEEYTQLMKKEMEEKEAKYSAQQKEAKDKGGFDLKKAEDSEDDDLYRIDDDMSWEDDEENPVFYSNAMQAVDAIRQDKAAPQQWLAMIVKNGGLKAGEDRWLGLSDWLNSQDKKSITKKEVKNFIRMNQIYVEETQYGAMQIFDAVERMYPGFGKAFSVEEDHFTETPNYAIKDLHAAVDLYNKHRPDNYKIEIDKDGNVTDDEFEDMLNFAEECFVRAANSYDLKAIDSLRLNYTTKGLDNNREIALTVPTIEPWGQSDTLHFGDAGEGRTVAWVRFGDAYYNKNGEPTEVDKQWDAFMNRMAEKYGKDRKDTLGLLTKMTDEEREEMNRLDKLITEKEKRNMGRVLVIDEIQSKRHQEGRKKGYKSEIRAQYEDIVEPTRKRHSELVAKRDELIDRINKMRNDILHSPEAQAMIGEDGYLKDGMTEQYHALYESNQELTKLDNERGNIVRELRNLEAEMRNINAKYLGGIPDAPFDKNWHELAMKRMLRYAAENGYDKIAWTTGAQQADRYDLGDSIEKIQSFEPDGYAKQHGEYRNIQIDLVDKNEPVFVNVDKDGNIMSSEMDELRGRNLSDVLGKDLADKILSDEAGGEYSGDDLRIGGEGMKGFYDQILPRFMDKYGKKWGVKTRQIELPDLEKSAQTMWSIDVTPQMKESVMLGQPMFRDREQFNEGETFPIYRGEYHSSYNVLGNRKTYSTDLMPDTYLSEQALLDALRNQYPEYYVTIEDGNVKMQTFDSLMADTVIAQTAKKAKGTASYVQRKTKRAIDAVEDMARRMNLDVDVLTSTEGLSEKKSRAKGWFNPKTHKIVIVLPNHRTQSDVINSLLHEGVAHYGLRKMFGEHFDTFLDNVYNNVDPIIKARIDAAMKRNGWDRHTATEEYLARLAERTDFEHAVDSGWWQKIKNFFINMLAKAGFNTILTDNELRYILWRSYDNLLHPDDRRNIFDTAREIDMQRRLDVSMYDRMKPTGMADTSRQVADRVNEEMLNRDVKDIPSEELLLSLQKFEEDERNEAINELVRRVREGDARVVFQGREIRLDGASDAQIAGTIIGGWGQLRLSGMADETLGGMVQGSSQVEGRPISERQDPSSDIQLAVRAWAEATGYYISEEHVKEQSLGKRVFGNGFESNVYRTADGKKVIKFISAEDSYYENPLLKRMTGIALLSETGFVPLNVIGYSVDERGKLRVVAEQEYIEGATVDDIFDDEPLIKMNNYLDIFMEEELGLVRHIDEEGKLYHMKDGIIYKDIHGGNVIVDSRNRRYVIDCYVSLADDDKQERTGTFAIEDNEKELFSIRTKEPPKKTGKGYKVFVLKDGQLYPPMVANPNGEGTPVGVWLDADAAPIAGQSKTGRPQVKAGGKGTQGGSGQLAYRPGWHLGTIPYALQFNRKDKNGERTLFPNNFVWAEVEYADDVDYQDEARQEGMNANGKYQHSLAGLKHVPTDGSYKYRTNPDPRTDEWVITGAMRVNRILSREEVDDLVRKAGREPQPMQEGDVLTKETLDELNDEIKAYREADEMGLLYRDDDDWTDDIAQQMYEEAVAKDSLKWQEAWQDSMAGLKAIQDAIAAETGKAATGAENAYNFENRMHGRAKNMTEQYDWNYYRPMLKAFSDFIKERGLPQQEGMEYLISKSGLERNIYYAFRDAAQAKLVEDIKKEREKLEKEYANKLIDEGDYILRKKDLEEKERDGVDDIIRQVRETLAYQRAKDDYQNGNISYTEYLRRIESVIRSHIKDYDTYAKDYSGLTETFAKEMYDDAQAIRKQAQRTVDPKERRQLWKEYDNQMRQAYQVARQVAEDAVFAAEDAADILPNHAEVKNKVNDLWEKINAATKETLKQSYESGLMSRNTYNKVRAMFDYYIPLRGWEEDKASDVYTYMGKDNVFNPAVKKTWGRRSQADNPLAYIGNIAVSTILSGHRNQMKQHFLNYVMNNPTSLVSISESWYENIAPEGDSPMWVLRTADTAGKSPDEIVQIVNDFNDEMRQKQREGKAMPVTGRLRLDVHATSGQKAEHVVEVQRAGHTYQLYINGNPKAAQALNGTAAKAVSRISQTYLGQKITKLNRNMAMFFTSKNPAFVVSNLSRDLNMAGASVAIKEGKAYNKRFITNVTKVLTPRLVTGDVGKMGVKGFFGKGRGVTGMMPKLLSKWKDGKLDMSDETQRYFKEFMDEGGETGFVNMLSIESFKEKMQKEIREMNGSSILGSRGVKETSVHKALRLLGDTFEFYNRCAEDATRFIVYMTSRQMGKSLEDSIADAKDVTLNFNRKGTGAMGNAEIRDLFIFVNPAIQALGNMYKMATGNTLKFGVVTAAFMAGGAFMAAFNQWMLNLLGDDDDKEAYWNLPPWVRKNNLVFWIPFTKNFVTIPLAQEFRVFYGIGEMLSSMVLEHPVDKWGLEVFSSVADLVPINPTGNGGNLMVDFAPTMVQPLMQVGENIDFTGKPIWKENQGNKHAPMYEKAYISTPTWMVKLSEGINDVTGGNEGRKGAIEKYAPFWGDYINNPAVWNHLLQGYFGGMYNTIAKTFDVGVTAASGELPKIYQTPVVNRFLNRPVERDNAGVLGEEYYGLTESRDALQYELRTWQKKAADGEEGAQERVDEILASDEWKRAEVVSHYEKIIKDLKAGERAATNNADKTDIKLSIGLYKQQMMEELNAIDEGKEPLTAAVEAFDNTKTFSEKNRLRMRIERLMMRQDGKNTKTKGRSADVEKALSYITDEERESRDTNDKYLSIASAEDVRDDARIKAAKAKLKPVADEYRKIQTERPDRAADYLRRHQKELVAWRIIDQQSRLMQKNKKLLGKGSDKAIMRLIANNRKAALKAAEGL